MRDRIGIFSGFGESRYEIVSKVLLPYHAQRLPLQGGFLVVSHDDLMGRPSAILGRVMQAMPIGDLFSTAGEDYLVDLVRLGHEVPEEVKKGRLRYRISLRLLGQLSESVDQGIVYTPAIRQMPHVGAAVGFPSEEVLNFLARGCADSSADPGPSIGHLALGDLAFDGSVRARNRNIPVHFRMDSLVGRRTAVFARAGMGKSNFVKVLLTRLYEARGAKTPGTLIIDPEGEYAFANASEPGLLDVPLLADRVVVYTDRSDYDPRYAKSVAGNCTVNLADFNPVEVINNILPEEKQNTVFANLIRALDQKSWGNAVRALDFGGYGTPHRELAQIVGKRISSSSGEGNDVVLGAMINNLVPVLRRLHHRESHLVANVLDALTSGKIVILDCSMRSGKDAKLLAAWLLLTIFSNNQEAYTRHGTTGGRAPGDAQRPLIPCLAVFEEAQFYLGGARLGEDSPFVRWFKEGRKFSLGSVLVTQQPGAIGAEVISQCDNFFVFHLLSRVDLDALATANLHYDGDIATSIGHEPIPGNCFLWSSRGLAFVTCARILHFAELVKRSRDRRDPLEKLPVQIDSEPKGVVLHIADLTPDGPRIDGYMLHLLRRLLEANYRAVLFAPHFSDSRDAVHLLAVRLDQLLRLAIGTIEEDRRSGRAPAELPAAPPTEASVVAVLTSAGLATQPALARDSRGSTFLLLEKSKLDLTEKVVAGANSVALVPPEDDQ